MIAALALGAAVITVQATHPLPVYQLPDQPSVCEMQREAAQHQLAVLRLHEAISMRLLGHIMPEVRRERIAVQGAADALKKACP